MLRVYTYIQVYIYIYTYTERERSAVGPLKSLARVGNLEAAHAHDYPTTSLPLYPPLFLSRRDEASAAHKLHPKQGYGRRGSWLYGVYGNEMKNVGEIRKAAGTEYSTGGWIEMDRV